MLDAANDTVFTPHYYILGGYHWHCDSKFPKCGNQCINQGRYCAVDPERDLDLGIAGMDVVQEDLRQLCIWKFSLIRKFFCFVLFFFFVSFFFCIYPCTYCNF